MGLYCDPIQTRRRISEDEHTSSRFKRKRKRTKTKQEFPEHNERHSEHQRLTENKKKLQPDLAGDNFQLYVCTHRYWGAYDREHTCFLSKQRPPQIDTHNSTGNQRSSGSQTYNSSSSQNVDAFPSLLSILL